MKYLSPIALALLGGLCAVPAAAADAGTPATPAMQLPRSRACARQAFPPTR
jgi:hypothetical protein